MVLSRSEFKKLTCWYGKHETLANPVIQNGDILTAGMAGMPHAHGSVQIQTVFGLLKTTESESLYTVSQFPHSRGLRGR